MYTTVSIIQMGTQKYLSRIEAENVYFISLPSIIIFYCYSRNDFTMQDMIHILRFNIMGRCTPKILNSESVSLTIVAFLE